MSHTEPDLWFLPRFSAGFSAVCCCCCSVFFFYNRQLRQDLPGPRSDCSLLVHSICYVKRQLFNETKEKTKALQQ